MANKASVVATSSTAIPVDMSRLPSMIGFEPLRVGIPQCEWTSPCYLLADRDLVVGEVVRVWAVDRGDGRILKVVALTATKDNCKKDQWPKALVDAVRADDTLVEGAKLLHAGVMQGTSFEASAVSRSTADFRIATSNLDCNRLWVLSSRARLFTSAPFASNQVIADDLAHADFTTAERLCVQVRDRCSQGLFESIIISLVSDSEPSVRSRALCQELGKRSHLLWAGALAADGVTIAPAEQGNALWIAQLSNLAVTVESAPWLQHGAFAATRALTVGESLSIHVLDDVTGMPLPDSPFIFEPAAEVIDKAKWPTALAAQLKTSSLGAYLELRLDSANAAVTGRWMRAGIASRIVMSEPLENIEWVPMVADPEHPEQAMTAEALFNQLKSQQEQIDEVSETLSWDGEYKMYWGPSSAHDKRFRVITVDIDLEDSRTRYPVSRRSFKFVAGGGETRRKRFSRMLVDAMQDVAQVRRPDATVGCEPDEYDHRATIWLPAGLRLTAHVRVHVPHTIFVNRASVRHKAKRSSVKVDVGNYPSPIHLAVPSATPDPAAEDLREFDEQYEQFEQYETVDQRAVLTGFATNGSMGSYPVLATDGVCAIANTSLRLRLEQDMLDEGVRFISWGVREPTIDIFMPTPSTLASPRVIASYVTLQTPCHAPSSIELDKPVDTIASFKPQDTLCADRCMTLGAHVYDTGGARENGVDENTGLFHAHYPLASLRGLGGTGPELDLTLHYSAVRANEGALGDGWALRFSYFDNRRRILTLSTGQTLTLSKAQMKTLSADKNAFLDQDGYRITQVEGDENAWTAVTLQSPPGVEGRQEVLRLPATHDLKEAGESYKGQYREKLQTIIANLTRWIDKEQVTSAQIKNFKEQRTTWQAQLKEIDRSGLVLVTASIRSAEGGELQLQWKGIEGHIQLMQVTDTGSGQALLTVTHGQSVTQGKWQSTFTVWPDTEECYQVTLDIRNCLLESLKRYRPGGEKTPERRVEFGYGVNDALDRVLTSIAEEDGSVEVVQYSTFNLDLAPRVSLHTLIPGAGQPNISHSYEWQGEYQVEGMIRRHHGTADFGAEPFIQTHWQLGNYVRVVDRIIDEQPGVSRRTTRYTYPETAPDGPYKHLLLARPNKIEVTTEDLVPSQAQEVKS